ncbi:MAG: hypothetical protein JSV78_03940 [Phycisphaerales bacterium]|nr:MAG: hypothetical protein JSV78_03940 [Phycisphaerales bacterium]
MTAFDDGSSRFRQRSNIVTRARIQLRRGGLGKGKALVAQEDSVNKRLIRGLRRPASFIAVDPDRARGKMPFRA